jgi:ribosomal subunit interface protein
MQLVVKGHKLDISDSLRNRVSEAFQSLFEKYFGDGIEADVIFSKHAHEFHSHVKAHIGKGIDLQAEGRGGDAYSSFDEAIEHLAKRLRRYKRRLKDHHKETDRATSLMAQQFVIAPLPEEESEEVAIDDSPLIVAESATEVPSLTVSQAVMRMDLVDAPALMFKNAAHDRLNMVYRRSDGNIGWVDPAQSS